MNGPVFSLGWVVGVAAISTVVYVVSDFGDVSGSSGGSDTSYWIKLVVGVLLVLLAIRAWRNGRRRQTPPARSGCLRSTRSHR